MPVLERAREHGVVTVGITNEAGSALARMAEHVVLVRAGKGKERRRNEDVHGAISRLLSTGVRSRSADRPGPLARLAASVERRSRLEPRNRSLSERYTFMDHAVVVARGLNYSNAFEFALKLMEHATS